MKRKPKIRGSIGTLLGNYRKIMGFSGFFLHILVNYELIICLNWLINILELLLTVFSVNSYYFRLINGLTSSLMAFFCQISESSF